MFEPGENEEKVRRMLPIIVMVAVALLAVVLVYFLFTKVLTPPPPVYDFRLELNTTRVEVLPGKVVNTLITLVPEGAFQGSVTLKIEKPGEVDYSVSNWVLTPSSRNAILTLNTTGLLPGTYPINVSGSYLEVERKTRLTIVVKEVEKPWFEASVSLQPGSIIQTEEFLLNISITPHAGFNETIGVSIMGLPGSTPEKSLIEKGVKRGQIIVKTNRSIPVGVNNFTVVLNSTSHQALVNLTIEVSEAPPPDFQILFQPNITIAKPGDVVNILVKVKPIYGFDETVHVYSSHIGLILNEFNGSDFFLTPRNYSGVVMTMQIDERSLFGIYVLTFIVETSSRMEVKGVKLGVANVSSTYNEPTPSIVAYFSRVDASPGRKTTVDFLLGSLNGFEGEVLLRVSKYNSTDPDLGMFYFSTGEGFPKMGVSIERVNITVGEARFVFLSLELKSTIASGVYRINVELCVEHTPPNMAFPLLKAISVYTLELHVG
ncbi:MAG: hypothetical protein FGF48_03235 [Candidatus Brockarchaeota archaeon]|nr:hypothetical protein [Candidatus Brockarchaeota archaeon]